MMCPVWIYFISLAWDVSGFCVLKSNESLSMMLKNSPVFCILHVTSFLLHDCVLDV